MDIIFRTDASLQIGTGHVVRCLTLAHALREHGAVCRFVCREHPGHLLDEIREQGFEALALPRYSEDSQQVLQPDEPLLDHVAWLGTDWASDAEATESALGDTCVDWLIVDHYALDARWESALRTHCRKIMVIDDLADRDHDCDLLLDQNLVADMAHRYDDKLPANCGKMLGPGYALLQPQYSELHSRTPPREGPVQRVLVYFGGADTGNLTGLAIAAFLSLNRSDIGLDVVINPNGPHSDTIRRQVHGQQNITLHAGLPSLAPLMVKADLAIGGGGATSWERCCLGLPTLVITLAENQEPIAAELDRQGLVRWLGRQDKVSQKKLVQELTEIVDAGLSPSWSRSCQQLVDGGGVGRVCSILLLNAKTPLRARLARLDDEAMFLEWANDPLVRENAFTTDTIDPNTHRTWFRKRLNDPEHCRLYVVETYNGLPIGQVRFEQSDDAWEVDYALGSHFRGRKLGKRLMQTAITRMRECVGKPTVLVGKVKFSNMASRRLFEALGFESDSVTPQVFAYRRILE